MLHHFNIQKWCSGAASWNHSSWKTWTQTSDIVNIIDADDLVPCIVRALAAIVLTRAHFLSLARSKLRICLANHRAGYWSNLSCDWPSTAWDYSEEETENGPRISWTDIPHDARSRKVLEVSTPNAPYALKLWFLYNMYIVRCCYNAVNFL